MDKLNDLINEAYEKNVNEMLKSIKFLLDYKKITLKEYQKILKRIHNKKLRETYLGLRECNENFHTVVKVPEGIYLEDVQLKECVSLESSNIETKDYGYKIIPQKIIKDIGPIEQQDEIQWPTGDRLVRVPYRKDMKTQDCKETSELPDFPRCDCSTEMKCKEHSI